MLDLDLPLDQSDSEAPLTTSSVTQETPETTSSGPEFKPLATVSPNDPGGWIHFCFFIYRARTPQQLIQLGSYVVREWQALPRGAEGLTW